VPPEAPNVFVSFVLKGFEAGAWKSRAFGRWLVSDNPDLPWVKPGAVIVVTEGPKPVGYYFLDLVGP
jgi:hypothetical protein